MWVLDAWENAEVVWYSLVWEKTKESSNVIDYNINEEITTNTSAIFNANNDTTTGMATVTPWVNAPKLIESTSIYKNAQNNTWWALLSGSVRLIYPDDTTGKIRTWTMSDEYWNIKFENKTGDDVLWDWVIIPTKWWYQLYIAYPTWWSTFALDVKIYIAKGWHWNDILIHSYTGQKNTTQYYWTLQYNFNAWDVIYAEVELRYSGSSVSFTANKTWTIQLTKL